MDKPSTSEPVLPHPLLKAALSSLNLRQDEEIARYQSQQHQLLSLPASPSTEFSSLPEIAKEEAALPATALTTNVPRMTQAVVLPKRLIEAQSSEETMSLPPTVEESQTQEGKMTQALEPDVKEANRLPSPSPAIADDEPTAADTGQLASTPQQNSRNRLALLGISALLLIGAASALLVVARFAPARLRTANLAKRSNQESSSADTNGSKPETPVVDDASKLANEAIAPRPSVPVPVPPVPAAPGESAPQPELESPYSDLTSALLPPSLRPQQSVSSPESSAPAPILKQTQPPDAPIAEVKSNYYYVLAPYTDEFSLEAAQAKIPTASLARFAEGVRIQLGAFSQPEEAHQLVKTLKQAGIAAAVYRADS
ncbi:MAG: SPOR domain-containing protein [Cyanophyceae cyanobacterium]